MSEKKENPATFSRYTITAALPYTNGPIHIGHLAGVYIPADIYARYLRLTGKDVAFVCGSDEHGVAISMKAKKEGVTPQQIIDKYHAIIKQSFADFGISFNINKPDIINSMLNFRGILYRALWCHSVGIAAKFGISQPYHLGLYPGIYCTTCHFDHVD